MHKYTVIGQYEYGNDTGDEFFVHHVEASDPRAAAEQAVREMGSPAMVVAVFAGEHNDLYGPDSTVYDFEEDEDEEEDGEGDGGEKARAVRASGIIWPDDAGEDLPEEDVFENQALAVLATALEAVADPREVERLDEAGRRLLTDLLEERYGVRPEYVTSWGWN